MDAPGRSTIAPRWSTTRSCTPRSVVTPASCSAKCSPTRKPSPRSCFTNEPTPGSPDLIVTSTSSKPTFILGGADPRAREGELTGRDYGPDDLFLINSKSGTTGMPKCVLHTENRGMYFQRLAADAGDMTTDDVFLSAIPAPFGFGIWTVPCDHGGARCFDGRARALRAMSPARGCSSSTDPTRPAH
jgi:acyl-CoA synthetase (AMP-forming)/AMP-acid ligase II